MKKSIIKKNRWFARILGTPVALFFLFMLIGDFLDSSYYSDYSLYLWEIFSLIGMYLMSVGIIVAWIWEGIGGLLTVGGFILAYAMYLFVSKIPFIMFSFLLHVLFLISGLLFLFCWWQSRKLTSQASIKIVSK